jgi:hypothetical protein
MPTLHIQHPVPSFDSWKSAFDRDPMNRKGSGVLRYAIHRAVSDGQLVMVDMEFATLAEAERMLIKLRGLWAGRGSAVMSDPQAWIVETVETRDL